MEIVVVALYLGITYLLMAAKEEKLVLAMPMVEMEDLVVFPLSIGC